VEQEPASGGKESAEASIRNLAGFSVHADRPTGDKVRRADPYSVQVNIGNVSLLHGDWNKGFIEEHRYFPFGAFKDRVDSAAAGFNELAGKKEAGVLKSRR
jgi:predicted phage terminase large subunit-like protein